MTSEFDNWCRLCTAENSSDVNIFSKMDSSNLDLKELIFKHFSITVSEDDKFPKAICSTCYGFIEKIVQFTKCVQKANQLFLGFSIKQETPSVINVEKQVCVPKPITNETCIIQEDKPNKNATLLLSIKSKRNDNKQIFVQVKSQGNSCLPNKNTINTCSSNIFDINKSMHQKRSQSNLYSPNEKTTNTSNFIVPSKKNRITLCLNEPIAAGLQEKMLTCQYCDKKYLNKWYLHKHVEKNHMQNTFGYLCQYCNEKFGTIYGVKNHIYDKHRKESNMFICKKCGKIFSNIIYLRFHIDNNHTDKDEVKLVI